MKDTIENKSWRCVGLDIIWDSVLKMTAIGIVLFALALWRFRRQFGG